MSKPVHLPPETPRVVVVVWEDAYVQQGASLASTEYTPEIQESVGFVVADTEAAIGLAANSLHDLCLECGEREAGFRDVMWIPRKMVHEIREYT